MLRFEANPNRKPLETMMINFFLFILGAIFAVPFILLKLAFMVIGGTIMASLFGIGFTLFVMPPFLLLLHLEMIPIESGFLVPWYTTFLETVAAGIIIVFFYAVQGILITRIVEWFKDE